MFRNPRSPSLCFKWEGNHVLTHNAIKILLFKILVCINDSLLL